MSDELERVREALRALERYGIKRREYGLLSPFDAPRKLESKWKQKPSRHATTPPTPFGENPLGSYQQGGTFTLRCCAPSIAPTTQPPSAESGMDQ